MIVGELIKLYRTKHDLSLEDLSVQTGVDKTVLHRLEQGSLESSKYIPNLIAWLFTDKNYGKSNETNQTV